MMAEHEGGRTEQGLDIDDSLKDKIDHEYAMALSAMVSEQIGAGLTRVGRVIYEKTGHDIKATLHLNPDLDPGIFLDELRDLKQVDVQIEYAVASMDSEAAADVTKEQQASEVVIQWQNQNDNFAEVMVKEGDEPVISTWAVGPDGKQRDLEVGDLNGSQAQTLQEVLGAVGMALDEQETFAETGRGVDARYDPLYLKRRGSND